MSDRPIACYTINIYLLHGRVDYLYPPYHTEQNCAKYVVLYRSNFIKQSKPLYQFRNDYGVQISTLNNMTLHFA